MDKQVSQFPFNGITYLCVTWKQLYIFREQI